MGHSNDPSRLGRRAVVAVALAALLAPAAAPALPPPPPCTALTCPTDITVGTDPGFCFAVVDYPPPTETGTCTVEQASGLPSGSEFPTGTTTNSFRDETDHNITCSFNVKVNDVEPPTITCPPDQIRRTGRGVVDYPQPTVMDNCGAGADCVPMSGSVFPQGETTVTCTANDSVSTATCTFAVIVRPAAVPAAGLLGLGALVAGLAAFGAWATRRRRRSAS